MPNNTAAENTAGVSLFDLNNSYLKYTIFELKVTGLNPVEALIFQASSIQLLKLENLPRWSFFTLTDIYR